MTDGIHEMEVEIKPEHYCERVEITVADIKKGPEHLLGLIADARAKIRGRMIEDGAVTVEGISRKPDSDLRFDVHVSKYGLVMPQIVKDVGTVHDRLRFVERARKHYSEWVAMKFSLKVARVKGED